MSATTLRVTVRVRAAGVVRSGRAVDCRPLDIGSRALVRAVRSDGAADAGVRVDCPPPGPVHEYVGHVHPDTGIQVRAALALVARGRGLEAPQDADIAAIEADLAALDPPTVDLGTARERVAAAAERDVKRLREAVAARRGAVEARRNLGADADAAADRLAAAAADLSEAETERVAAAQALDRARERAREARDARERRLRLQDRVDNLRRAARKHLAGRLRDEFAAAVAAVPGEGRVPDRPAGFEGDPVTAALAVARLASIRAPVVVAADRFDVPASAARCLGSPVILGDPG